MNVAALLAGCAAMALRDFFGTLLVIAQSRGQAVRAGVLDACGDYANILMVVFGAGLVIRDGFTLGTLAVVTAMAITSFVTTAAATHYGYGTRHGPVPNPEAA